MRAALLRKRVKRLYSDRQEWQYYLVPSFPGPAGLILPDEVEFVAWAPEEK